MPSLVRHAEHLASRVLPANVSRQLHDLVERLPLRLDQSAPVVQMFVNDARTRSFVGVHNFFSCLLADEETAARVQLRLYAPNGRLVVKHALELAHFGARAVDVKAILDRRGVDVPHGIVTVQITPRAPRRRSYRELGLATAHFFVFFRDRANGSVEQTHPLSTTDRANKPSDPFCSSQIVSTAKLRELVAFQYNPGPRAHELEHSLADATTGEIVARVRHAIPALGSARSEFAIPPLARDHAQLLFRVDALPSANAKPMLRRVFESGSHSMSHA